MKKLYEIHAEICKVFSNPTRLEILNLLRDKEMSVTELIKKSKLSQTNISQHLAIMKSKGILMSKRILDIGCGDGKIALYLILSLNCYIDGIDLDKGKVHRANENFSKKPAKGLALCYLCDSRNIDKKFKKDIFNIILITHTLHHLEELKKVLLKAKYVLKQKGKIIVSEYKQKFGEKVDNCPRFSNKKIRSMLRTAGFKNIKNHNINKNFII